MSRPEQGGNGAVLLCGGKGTRLAEMTNDEVPKSLYPVGGRPLMRYSIDTLPHPTFSDLVFAVGHHRDQIMQWVTEQSLPHSTSFSDQERPGVLEAVVNAVDLLPRDEGNIVCNTDEIRIGLNIQDAIQSHRQSGTLATLVGAYTNQLYRHGVMEVREHDNRVTGFKLKSLDYIKNPAETGIVFTGLMLIDKAAIEQFDPHHDPNWMGLLDPLLEAGELSAYVVPNLCFFNVGTRDEYSEASQYLAAS